VSTLLGHANPQMTMRYARTDLEMIKRELEEVYLRKRYREDQLMKTEKFELGDSSLSAGDSGPSA